MKNLILISSLVILTLSCDKVENIYPYVQSTDLDYSLSPYGDSASYWSNAVLPFSTNTNTNRNILVEDFTGHRCVYCPPAAELAKQLESDNPGRVFGVAIHTGTDLFDAEDAIGWNNIAPGDFQTIVAPTYIHNFANVEGLQIGSWFGPYGFNASSAFVGNPRGTVSRIEDAGQHTLSPGSWTTAVNSAIAANDLKVNIQAQTNFYPATNGLFLHTEIDVIDPSLTNDLYTVVYLVEDSLVKPQKFLTTDSLEYVHHNVMRGCIDGRPFGQKLDEAHKKENGKYYFNYSFALPDGPNSQDNHQYDSSNMHLLIYVRDAVTEEIYHVIEKHFN